MNKLVAVSAVALLMASPALAADPIMPAPAPITPAPLTSSVWDGFYAGVNAGYGWSEAYNAVGVIPGPLDQINGLSGGAQLGFNIQHDAIVFGVEADIQASGMSQDLGAPAAIGVDYFGTVRGRIGVDMGNGVLPYLTAGIAYGQGRITDPAGVAETQFHTGWAVGGGVEFKLQEQLSLKGEYLYTDLGQRTYTSAGPDDVGFRGHTIRAGVNFHF